MNATFSAVLCIVSFAAPTSGLYQGQFVIVGQLGSGNEINLIDGTNYLIIRDGFKEAEVWDTVILHKRVGGSKIGKALLAQVNLTYQLYVVGTSNSYNSANNKLLALKALLTLAHTVANTTDAVVYVEQLVDQNPASLNVVLHGTCVLADRMTIVSGYIKTNLDLELNVPPAGPNG